MDLETDGGLEDDDSDGTEAFDREIEAASRGDWAALGLDGPGTDSGAFAPASINEFLSP